MVALAAACGDGAGAGDDDDDADAALPGPCEEVVTGATFDLDPDGAGTQIHLAAAFDGDKLWIVYNRPDDEGSGGFDVFVAALACDGTHVIAPQRVTTTLGGNDVDPAIAIDRIAGVVYVVWQSDNGTGVDNLDILYRTYSTGGGAIMDADRVLETTREGAPVTGNAFFPDVDARGDGTAVIAAVRALEETGTFQLFTQAIDRDGAVDGAALDAIENAVTHSNPSVAVAGDGAVHVAWERIDGEDETVLESRIAPGATALDTPAPVAGGAAVSLPDLAVSASGEVRLAVFDGDDVQVYAPGGAPALVTAGAAGRIDHTPELAFAAGGDGEGALIWHRNESGIRNEVIAAGFDASYTLGAEVSLATGAPPYAPTIVHVRDDIYFVGWSEGTSPDFAIKGHLVRL